MSNRFQLSPRNPLFVAMLGGALGGGAAFDWYVDSVNGNDANTGTSEAQAFATIAALESAGISAGDKIGLARGSEWRESITVLSGDSLSNLQIAAFGTGNAPILDGSDIAANASFSKSGGYTNVYQINVTVDTGVTDASVRVCENGSLLAWQTSVANVDANAGSWYVSAHSGSITIYVHASDSSDVTANSKLYEYSSRALPLELYYAPNSTITGIVTRMGLNGAQSRLGVNNTAIDCQFNDGGKHNLLVRPGAILTGCTFNNAVKAQHASGSLLVYNGDVFNGESVTVSDCTFTLSSGDTGISAMNGHHNVSGNLDTVQLSNCTFTEFHNSVLTGFNDLSNLAISGCTFTNCQLLTLLGTASTLSVTISNSNWDSNIVNQRALSVGNVVSLIVDGYSVITRAVTDFGYLYLLTNGDVSLTNVTIDNRQTISTRYGVTVGSDCNLSIQRLTMLGTYTRVYNFTTVPTTWASDYNQFPTDAEHFGYQIGATNYTTFATYKSGTGKDANSTVS